MKKGNYKRNLSKKELKHYIKADFGYLTAFMKLYGIALSKSAAREEIGFFNEKINFVLNSESHPHHNFCDHIGVGYDELQGYPLPPTADHYVKHMMYHAHTGSLRSEEHTSELQSRGHLVCRLLLEKKNNETKQVIAFAT